MESCASYLLCDTGADTWSSPMSHMATRAIPGAREAGSGWLRHQSWVPEMSLSEANSEPWSVLSPEIRDSHMTEGDAPAPTVLPPGSVTGSPDLAQRIPEAQFSVLLIGSTLPVVNSLKPKLILMCRYSVHTHLL